MKNENVGETNSFIQLDLPFGITMQEQQQSGLCAYNSINRIKDNRVGCSRGILQQLSLLWNRY